MKSNAIDKATLEKLYLQDKFSDYEIADITGTSRRNVNRMRGVYAIKSIEDYERHPFQNLTDEEKQIIIGSMLGDGHIRLRRKANNEIGNNYPQLMFAQSLGHKEYFYWFKEKMHRWIYDIDKPIPIRVNKNPLYKTPALSLNLSTISHPVFNEFYNAFYPNGSKVVNFELLNKYFNEMSLAVWIMDDGGLTGNQHRSRLCTNGFTKEEVDQLALFLLNKYGLKTWVCEQPTKKSMTWEIHFDKDSTLKITSLIKDIVVPSMQYKLFREL